MKPAARLLDLHTCPIPATPATPPHVGGPITKSATKTMVGKKLSARVTDTCTCVGPPDLIVLGSLGVIIEKLCAARLTDLTAHGGVVQSQTPPLAEKVLIGEMGNPMLAMALAINPLNGTINCGNNLHAAIARLDGSDPNATSTAAQNGSWTQIENQHNTTIAWGQNMDQAYDQVRAGGHGTTAVVGIKYPNTTASHVVPMTNHYGVPVIIEGQGGGAVYTTAAQANQA